MSVLFVRAAPVELPGFGEPYAQPGHEVAALGVVEREDRFAEGGPRRRGPRVGHRDTEHTFELRCTPGQLAG